MVGLAIAKGVGSLFPKNTIVNKLSTGKKIDANAVKNALADVKRTVTAVKNKDWANAVTLPQSSKNTGSAGGIGSLQPSAQQTASVAIQQERVNSALAATAQGSVQPTLNLTNASNASLSDPIKGEFPAWILVVGVGAYFLLK